MHGGGTGGHGSDDSINITSPTSSISSMPAGDHPHMRRGPPPPRGARIYRPYGPSPPPPHPRGGGPRTPGSGGPPRGPPAQMFRPGPPYYISGARSPTPSPPYSPRGPPRRGGPPPGHPRFRGGPPRFRGAGGPRHPGTPGGGGGGGVPYLPAHSPVMSGHYRPFPSPGPSGPGSFAEHCDSAASTPPATPMGVPEGASPPALSPNGSGSDHTLTPTLPANGSSGGAKPSSSSASSSHQVPPGDVGNASNGRAVAAAHQSTSDESKQRRQSDSCGGGDAEAVPGYVASASGSAAPPGDSQSQAQVKYNKAKPGTREVNLAGCKPGIGSANLRPRGSNYIFLRSAPLALDVERQLRLRSWWLCVGGRRRERPLNAHCLLAAECCLVSPAKLLRLRRSRQKQLGCGRKEAGIE